MPDWARIREEFPALANWTYLNTATYGQMPRRAVEAVNAHFTRRDALACSDYMSWFDDADRVRALIGKLIGCDAADLAFVINASSALSLLLGGIDWQPGDRIVTLENEFPNHYYYTGHLGARGVEFAETPYDRFFDAITPRTRLVALSTVSYATGFRAPLDRIAPFLRERGVMLYVDGTQSLGALPFDVAAVKPDVYAVDGYKWLLCPNGGGFVYVSPQVRQWLQPSVIGWRSDKGWRNTGELHHGRPEFPESAERYEGGMLAFPSVYAMAACVEFLLELGAEAVEQRVAELAEKTRDVLRRAGGRVRSDYLPHHDSAVVCASFEGRDPSAIAHALQSQRVIVAARKGNLRVSPHFYNNEEDLDRLSAALKASL
jgi:selenocysteine lyase/cysteine desulfurase